MSTEEASLTGRLSVTLPPQPYSVGEARRLLAAQLRSPGLATAPAQWRLDLLDTAQLLVSELVTNAVLHARTDIGLVVVVSDGRVEVEVSDLSPRLPTARHYADTASTGRGMALVEALASECGVRPTSNGKSVWFALAVGPASVAAAATGTGGEHSVTTSDAVALEPAQRSDLVAVRLPGLPVALYQAFAQQAEALLREYLLVAFGDLEDLVGAVDPELPGDGVPGGLGSAAADRAAAAAEALGELTDAATLALRDFDRVPGALDLQLRLRPAVVPAFAMLERVLTEAALLADAGELLVPPSQPEIVALCRWTCRQVSQQVDGQPPQRWRPLADGVAPSRQSPDWDPGELIDTGDAVVAADDTNRILALTPAVTELLGWSAAELVGARLVALVPEELREAHIAGFTHYLATGAQRILEQTIPVPALHRDGHSVAVWLTVQARQLPGGRQVFLARMTAREPD